MEFEVLFTDEFGQWWDGLTAAEQDSIDQVVRLLMAQGPTLGFPYSSSLMSSTYAHMRELRVQHQGEPYRAIYAFDPLRRAILLVGGNKTGDGRWYETHVPLADRLYSEHLESMGGS